MALNVAPDVPPTDAPAAGSDARFRLDPTTRRLDGGTVLAGGIPLTVMRLTDAGAQLLDRIEAGSPVAATGRAGELLDRLVELGAIHPCPGPAMHTAADVTVVIPVRDRPDGLVATLRALDAAGTPGRVIVVDDGSVSHDTHRRIAEAHDAEIVRRTVSGGAGAARNTGLERVRTALVAFVDAGCEPQPGSLTTLLPRLTDERVALVAPRVTGATGPTNALARYERASSSLDLGPDEAPIRPGGRVPYVPAAALLARTEVIRSLGGFEEELHVGEDVDLVWRLVESGHRARYEPAAVVVHDHPREPGRWARRRFAYGTSAAPLDRRHPGAAAPVTLSPWSLAVWVLLAAGHPLAATVLAGGTTAALARRLDRLDHPGWEALRLAGIGHLAAGRLLGSALTRSWWPLALLAGLVSRRARRVLLAAAVVPALLEWRRRRPELDPARFALFRLIDDVAYGAGVWAGCAREGSFSALLPTLRNWPGNKAVGELQR